MEYIKMMEYIKILSPCLFNLYSEFIMRNPGLEEAQTGIKIARRNINNLRYRDNTTRIAESIVQQMQTRWEERLKAQANRSCKRRWLHGSRNIKKKMKVLMR